MEDEENMMINGALEIDREVQNESDINLFSDRAFSKVILSNVEESVYITIQSIELAEAKYLFRELTMEQKIRAIRYSLSRRIFESTLISDYKKQDIKSLYEESYGSLCAMNKTGTETIALESQLITRILYIAEAMSLEEFYIMKQKLMEVNCNYYVIIQVIESRLNFHKMKK